jgi:hypothetical protein
MKRIYKILIIAAMLFGISLVSSLEAEQLNTNSPKVIDFSNITLPSYKLAPNAKVTKEEESKDLSEKIEMCKEGKIP